MRGASTTLAFAMAMVQPVSAPELGDITSEGVEPEIVEPSAITPGGRALVDASSGDVCPENIEPTMTTQGDGKFVGATPRETRPETTQEDSDSGLGDIESGDLPLGPSAPPEFERRCPMELRCMIPDASAVLKQVDEFDILFRTFLWILDATSDPDVVGHVAVCVKSLHTQNMLLLDQSETTPASGQLFASSYLHGLKLSAIWHLASRALHAAGLIVHVENSEPVITFTTSRQAGTSITRRSEFMRTLLSQFYLSGYVDPKPEPMDMRSLYWHRSLRLDDHLSLNQKKLLGLFLTSQIRVLVLDMLDFIASRFGELGANIILPV